MSAMMSHSQAVEHITQADISGPSRNKPRNPARKQRVITEDRRAQNRIAQKIHRMSD